MDGHYLFDLKTGPFFGHDSHYNSYWSQIEELRIEAPVKYRSRLNGVKIEGLRELPKNNLRILLALLPVFYVVTTGT